MMVTHMSHSSSKTAVPSADCGSRDLNAHLTRVRAQKHLSTSRRKKKNQTVLFLDLIAGSSPERVFLTTNRSGQTEKIKLKKRMRITHHTIIITLYTTARTSQFF